MTRPSTWRLGYTMLKDAIFSTFHSLLFAKCSHNLLSNKLWHEAENQAKPDIKHWQLTDVYLRALRTTFRFSNTAIF